MRAFSGSPTGSNSPSHKRAANVEQSVIRRKLAPLVLIAILAVPTCVLGQGGARPIGAPPAQSGMNPGNIASPYGMYSSVSGLEHLNLEVNMKRSAAMDEWHKTGRDSACFFPPLSTVRDLTVGTAGLMVPKDAKKEYGKACESVLSRKNDDAEKHLRKAVELFPNYAASWVLLGQILEQSSKLPEAREACQHAVAADDHYIQGYLCLADVSGQRGEWQDALDQSNRAIALDPVNNAAAYVDKCAASLSLNRLAEAEESASKAEAIEIKTKDKDPRIHVLLAQIYDRKGDTAKEAVQLREFAKLINNPQVQAAVSQVIAELEKQAKQ